jgi:CRP-like cAMP-binding protein
MDSADWRIVRSTLLLGNMPPAIVQDLAGNLVPRVYEKGATLFNQGQPADAFFVILDGWVKIYRTTADGHEVVLHVFKRGETFAEAAMFLGGRYPASAETVSAARLLIIDGGAFRTRIRNQPELALSMLAAASHQLKALVEQIEQIKVRSAPQRIAEFILRLSEHQKGPATIELPFEKGLIANRLGMKPESFSRALARLRSLGVTVERDIIVIDDMAKLATFVEYAGEDE